MLTVITAGSTVPNSVKISGKNKISFVLCLKFKTKKTKKLNKQTKKPLTLPSGSKISASF